MPPAARWHGQADTPDRLDEAPLDLGGGLILTGNLFRETTRGALYSDGAFPFLDNNGTPLKVQQAILGHTNVGTSLLYTEAELARMRQAIAEFDVLMDANGRTLRSELQNQRVN